MDIALIEPFYSGSHQKWADGLKKYSAHDITLFTLPGRFWKWRMHGGAITLAQQFLELNHSFDLIIATDMLDLPLFNALIRKQIGDTPILLYFHENQITYPWSPTDKDPKLGRDQNYAFINYSSALAADHIAFNSNYHQQSFCNAIPDFLNQFPDHQNVFTIEQIKSRSTVLPLGMDFSAFENIPAKVNDGTAKIIWNHRWEFDKNPEVFFKPLLQLAYDGLPFELIVLGERNKKSPEIFSVVEEKLKDRIIHFGNVEEHSKYLELLMSADIAPTTSNQDFFGISVVEAIYANCHPLLPNRLAYPMHVPESEKRNVFYNSEEELKRKIVESIYKIDVIRNTDYSSWVEQYDWRSMGSVYDEYFEKITNPMSFS